MGRGDRRRRRRNIEQKSPISAAPQIFSGRVAPSVCGSYSARR